MVEEVAWSPFVLGWDLWTGKDVSRPARVLSVVPWVRAGKGGQGLVVVIQECLYSIQ